MKLRMIMEKLIGEVTGRNIDCIVGEKLEERKANIKVVFVVVRIHAEHKMSMESGASLVWYITF